MQPSVYPPVSSLSLSLSHIPHSQRQTIKQASPWLTHSSPCPPHHPKSQTEGELQPRIHCGAEQPWTGEPDLGLAGPVDAPPVSDEVTRRLQTLNTRVGPVKGNSSGFGQSKKAFILRRGGEEPCSGRGNDRSGLVNAASAMCLLLGRKQSKCWYSSNSRHVLSAAFLMTLVWHSPIADLWSCHGRQKLQFLWVRRCRGTGARPQPKNEHLFPDKSSDKNDILQLLSHVWNGWTSESLFMNTIFFTPSTPPQPDLWVHSPHQWVPTTKDLERGHMSVQPPSSQHHHSSLNPRGGHWRNHEPCQL